MNLFVCRSHVCLALTPNTDNSVSSPSSWKTLWEVCKVALLNTQLTPISENFLVHTAKSHETLPFQIRLQFLTQVFRCTHAFGSRLNGIRVVCNEHEKARVAPACAGTNHEQGSMSAEIATFSSRVLYEKVTFLQWQETTAGGRNIWQERENGCKKSFWCFVRLFLELQRKMFCLSSFDCQVNAHTPRDANSLVTSD